MKCDYCGYTLAHDDAACDCRGHSEVKRLQHELSQERELHEARKLCVTELREQLAASESTTEREREQVRRSRADFAHLERSKQLLSDEGAQRSRDLAAVMHERTGLRSERQAMSREDEPIITAAELIAWQNGKLKEQDLRIADLQSQLAAFTTALDAVRKKRPKVYCEKCGGAGWLRGHELDNPSEDTYNDTMTKYRCDGEAHKL